jgi:hypothetical protein
MTNNRHGGSAGKLKLSMGDLDASLDSFLVEAPAAGMRGPVAAAEDTVALNCTNAATCNVKCGPTAYWECGPTSVYSTCL